MKVGCPHMGSYTKLIQELGDYLGWEIIIPPQPTQKTIDLGVKFMQELMCFPAKLTLGSMIEVIEQGADHLIMFDSCGTCRLKTYWVLQQRALRKLGYDVTVHPVTLGRKSARDIHAIDPSISYWKAWQALIRFVYRVWQFDKQFWPEIMDESKLVKIGLTGEIFSILEPTVNKGLIEKIQKMGALVHNSLPLSYFIFKGFYDRGWMKRRDMDSQLLKKAKQEAHKQFPKEIGGHGNESIIHTLYYGMKGFDGVIHVLPFACMPENTVAPIVDDMGSQYNMPVMRLSFDEHTGEAGLDTRLEAFIDILKRKKGRRY